MAESAKSKGTGTVAKSAAKKTGTQTIKKPAIRLALSKVMQGCKRTRMLQVEGAVGIKPEPLHEEDSIQRALAQVRGVHPPPTMNIDGQQYPCVIEGSPRSPRLMMEDRGEHMRMYLEVGGAAVANVWAIPGPNIVFRGRVIPLEWTGPAQDLDPLMSGPCLVPKALLVRDPWRSVLAHAGQVPPQAEKAKAVRGRPQPILEMWEVDSRLCGRVRFRYHDDLPEIDPLERIGLIVAETKGGEVLRCERDRDLEFQRCNEFIKRGALVQRRGAFGFVADGDAADRFLAQVIPNLQGWEIRGREALHRGRPPKDIQVHTKVSATKDHLELNITAEVEGRNVPVKELLRHAARGQNLIVFKDGLRARINDEWLSRYRTLVEFGGVDKTTTKVKVRRHAAALAVGLAESGSTMKMDDATADLAKLAKGSANIPEIPLPDDINATLRDYQHQGFSWMQFLGERGLGGVLADDMGLGKTLQSLAFIKYRHDSDGGVHLVVAPRSVVDNWFEECAKFVPSVPVYVHLGLDRTKKLAELPKGGILLTSYNILQRDIKLLQQIDYATIILDEAHIIRNPEAKTTRAALKLQGQRRMCLSGTPVQNCAEDLWPIFHFLMPGFLGRRKTLKETLQEDGDAIDRLRSRVAPFVLRRIKKEVAKELPPKTEIQLHAQMAEDQQIFYRELMERESMGVSDLLNSKGLERSRVSILAAITRLRQAACHPALVGGENVSSSKVDLFLDLVDELIAEGHRALVFSSFTKFLGLISTALEERGYTFQYLDGRTRDRGGRVKAFQNGDDPLFLISLKAGGVGLNLTAADYVLILDPWWNPAAEDQAADRAYRIGQDKPVMVYRIVTNDSIEERVLRLQAEKRRLVGDLALEGLAKALQKDDVLKLFELSVAAGS
ncbi:MAG: DEAD/DEAH box helicase [Planctomycetota bacterium]|jgi:superfamily II DNA or RNA helicase|nr:DEAD/DEAH box helicase [Planctomycetota bacterium]